MSLAPVLAVRKTSSGAVTDAAARVKGVWIIGGTTAGTLQLKNGGSSGTVLIELDTPANTSGATVIPAYLKIPSDGVYFKDDVYATFTGGTAAATVFYG